MHIESLLLPLNELLKFALLLLLGLLSWKNMISTFGDKPMC